MDKSQEERRAEFSLKTKNLVKERAGYICANPECKLMTIGPSEEDAEKVILIGEVAHILPAKKRGPRDIDPFTPEERSHMDNAIYLCASCASMIDKNNGIDFPLALLKGWKVMHEEWMRNNLNKRLANRENSISIQNGGTVILGDQTVNIFHAADMQPTAVSHDIENFKQLMELCNEDHFVYIVRQIKERHRIRSSEQDKFDEVLAFFKKGRNAFLTIEIKTVVSVLLIPMNDLSTMIGDHFDMYPYTQQQVDYTIELEPRLFHWTGVQVYHDEKQEGRRLSGELINLCDVVLNYYDTFLATVKTQLLIK